jgi:hypothetical protein
MRRYQPLAVLILLPALCLMLAAPGCGKKEEPAKGDNAGKKKKSDEQPGDDGEEKGGKETKMTELDNKEWGTLTGTVTYKGEPPEPAKINMGDNKDKSACHQDADPRELIEQKWLVNADNKGVENVVIYLKAPKGKFFKIHESYLKRKKDKWPLVHQPHCAFIPHTQVYWASYYDKETGEEKKSGEKLIIKNDAKFQHNTAHKGDEDNNPGASVTLAPGKVNEVVFNADLDTPITLTCQFHPWMNAKVWALNTPYCARTDKDGKFKIENVPIGVELRVVAWHDGVKGGFIDGKNGKKMTLEKDQHLKYSIK